MITFTRGNLLEANTEALVNTVNTVGVMGKGIALMFKEAFPENFRSYAKACKAGNVQTGKMFVTERNVLIGPRWIINFPTKQHWRNPSQMEWIDDGLADLYRFIQENEIHSIAIPPLGSGNGGLDWNCVKEKIITALSNLPDLEVLVYEPTRAYQNVTKKNGVQKLTPARALIADLVRRYCSIGIDCSILEIQKLAWFLERTIEHFAIHNPLNFQFTANRYGPYAHRLMHLLNALDGSYLQCEKRISDAIPSDIIRFDYQKQSVISDYLSLSENSQYVLALEKTEARIDGLQSPLGLEALATVDWLLTKNKCQPTIQSIKKGLKNWTGGNGSGDRKLRLFNDKLLQLCITRLT